MRRPTGIDLPLSRDSLRSPTLAIGRYPGTYALIMRADQVIAVTVGGLGAVRLDRGWYAYIGSALGPGGVGARVGRHLAGGALRWHLDYLRTHTRVAEVWYCFNQSRRESQWVATMTALPTSASVIDGFGASDSVHRSHLFYFPLRPSWKVFGTALLAGDRDHPALGRWCLSAPPSRRAPR